jgi:hypothetical protein
VSAVASTRTHADTLGRRRLSLGGAFGLTGALIGLVLPAAFLLGISYVPGGSIALGSTQVLVLTLLLVAGLLFLIVSFMAYRSAFSALRAAEPKFWSASLLCFVGSLGLLVILVASVAVSGSAANVADCARGSPSHALSCLRAGSSGELLGASLAVLGFWIAWVGGLGIVLGLGLEGRRARAPSLMAGAVAYALLLVVLVGPFAALFLSLPAAGALLVALPALALIAPALVLLGARRG